jgi:Zn-dependent protease with chaperone function
MKMATMSIAACLLLSMVIVPLAVAQGGSEQEADGRDPAFEQEIYDRLVAINPDAVSIFQEATRAMDAGALTTAKAGFERVLILARDFPDAARRLSYVELELGNTEAALECARQALAAEHSPYNHGAMARAPLSTEDPDRAREAMMHAWKAANALPDNAYVNVVLLWAGEVNSNADAIRQASTKLTRLAPELSLGHYFAGIMAAEDHEWEEAERELLLAQDLGMPAEDVQAVLDGGIAGNARRSRENGASGWTRSWSHVPERWYWRLNRVFDRVLSLLRWPAFAYVGMLVGLVALFLAGTTLSRLTLAAAHRPGRTRGVVRAVRTVYRMLIAASSLYFYAFIVVLICSLLGAIVLLVLFAAMATLWWAASYGLFGVCVTPAGILMSSFLGWVLLRALYRVARTALIHTKEPEPGRPLVRADAPALWALAEHMAERVGTRAVDEICVTPAPSIGVVERGGLIQKLRGTGQRYLILGLGLLPVMTQGQLKAILAHEYGHFITRDTVGGDLALRVRLSLRQMARRLAVHGQASRINPVWLFLSLFHRVFQRITLGASRLQEIQADRYAATGYGTDDFVGGLTHTVRQGLIFEERVTREVRRARRFGRRGVPNLYTCSSPEFDPAEDEFRIKMGEVMNRPTSPYDSHPAMRERIELVQQLGVTGEVEGSQESVWDLLLNAEALQEEMSAAVSVW